MPDDVLDARLDVLQPGDTQALLPALRETRNPDVWVYRYTHPDTGWCLSVATHGAPHSDKLSLGGFRIAPAARVERGDYDNDVEAIGLAMGMEEKVHWSRVVKAGGPLGRAHVGNLVGGKCVLRPTPDARIGQPLDFVLLDWALSCFRDFERTSGVRLNTGQDLGHGLMSDGATGSLDYLAERFHGCVFSDTSKPTGEGNYYVLKGMLHALGIPMAGARIALVGCGNIGDWVLRRVSADGARAAVVEARPEKRDALREELGIDVRPPEEKLALLAEPFDALVVNANGGTLNIETCEAIAANPAMRIVCGSENLAMPDPRGADVLHAARKLYAPTEYGGMMGYLTAIEEYYARRDGEPFDLGTMLDAARILEDASCAAARAVRQSGYERRFEDAVEALED